MLKTTKFLIFALLCLILAHPATASQKAYVYAVSGSYGIMDFQLGTFSPEMLYQSDTNISAATFAEGLYYALHVDNEGNPTGIYSYDLKTGSSEKYMDLMASSVICDMTYDYASQSILFLGDAWPNTTLLRLDLATKEITTLHDFTDTSMMCIAADYDGEIYLLDRQGILYRMDKTTYELTSVIDTDQYINGLQSMDFDHNTGKLYWVSTNYGICYNYEIDVDNETMNSIGSVSNTQLVGLFTGYTEAGPNAPAAPTQFVATPGANGANSCDLSWALPTTTFNRKTLANPITAVTVYRDGEAIATLDASATSYTDNAVTAGNHQYKVTASNSVGEGMFNTTSVYVGEDLPSAPTNVVAQVSGNTIQITWDAPTTGLNGGWISSNITYNVTRINDNKVIQEATTQTSATDAIEGAYAGYSYRVTASTAAGAGESAISNTVHAGVAQPLPFTSVLETEQDLSNWTIIDGDGNGASWQMGTLFKNSRQGAEVIHNNDNGSDDWLITPPAKLSAGVVTEVSFLTYTAYSYNEQIEVRIAKAGTDPQEAQVVETISIQGSKGYYGYDVKQPIPAMEEDGEYCIYLHYATAPKTTNNWGVHINDFTWKENNTGSISGTVSYDMMGWEQGLYGATVTVGDLSATTDWQGKYTISEIPEGEYDVTVKSTGYVPQSQHVRINAGDQLTLDFMLEQLQQYDISGTVTDDAGNPIMGASIKVEGEQSYSDETDETGAYTIRSIYEGTGYTLTIEKNNYIGTSETFDLTQDIEKNYSLKTDIIAPYNVQASDNEDGNILVEWSSPKSLKELHYDNGTVAQAYSWGEYGSDSHVLASVYRQPSKIYEIKWQSVKTETSSDEINLLIIDLDYGGNPTSDVLYEVKGVPTVDGEWNTYRLPEPITAERGGFLVAVSGKGATLAIDNGTEDGTIEFPNTQCTNNNYVASYNYTYFDERTTNQSARFLLRAVCENIEPEGSTMPEISYDLYRVPESAQDDESAWTAVAQGIKELSHEESNVPSGIYTYAVKAIYGEGEALISDAAFSTEVRHNIIADVTVNVTANSDPAHANGATVTLYNDKNNYSATVTDGIATFADVDKGSYNVNIVQRGFETLKAENVNITGEDKAFSFSYELKQSFDKPATIDVIIADEKSTDAELVWNVQPNINEGFEGDDYTDFEVNPAGNIGWQYIDNDGRESAGFANTSFPNMNEKMAAITFNAETTTPPLSREIAYSGVRALAFFAARDLLNEADELVHYDSDDYLISPELKPYKDFKFSFYACSYEEAIGNLERIKVGYSTTTPELDSFIWLDEDYFYVPLKYEQYTYDIPAEAKYVVINNHSISNFMLLVDDIFIGVDGQVQGNPYMPVNVTGYEVYLDGEKLTDTQDTRITLSNLTQGKHTAGVVQKFATGKSEPLEIEFEIGEVGIENVTNDGNIRIYAYDDMLYINGDYATAMIYNAAGTAVMQLDGESQADMSALSNGIYIVRALDLEGNATVQKIVIR